MSRGTLHFQCQVSYPVSDRASVVGHHFLNGQQWSCCHAAECAGTTAAQAEAMKLQSPVSPHLELTTTQEGCWSVGSQSLSGKRQ